MEENKAKEILKSVMASKGFAGDNDGNVWQKNMTIVTGQMSVKGKTIQQKKDIDVRVEFLGKGIITTVKDNEEINPDDLWGIKVIIDEVDNGDFWFSNEDYEEGLKNLFRK